MEAFDYLSKRYNVARVGETLRITVPVTSSGLRMFNGVVDRIDPRVLSHMLRDAEKAFGCPVRHKMQASGSDMILIVQRKDLKKKSPSQPGHIFSYEELLDAHVNPKVLKRHFGTDTKFILRRIPLSNLVPEFPDIESQPTGSRSKIKKFIRSIQRGDQLGYSLVDLDMNVLDGNHRAHAWNALGLTIPVLMPYLG